jgi:hypothetical protein
VGRYPPDLKTCAEAIDTEILRGQLSVTVRFFDRFILLFIYACSYVIICLCVYSWLGIVEFVLEGILAILDSRVFWSFYE